MHDVFISYSHNDVSIREAVVQKLESAGIKCWYAPRDIQPGEEWADAITNGLKNCRVMILIFTASSNDSAQVLREVGLGVDFKKCIIPFRCDETVPSGSMRYYLSTLHWMDSTEDQEESLDQLLELTQKNLTGPKETVPAPAPVSSKPAEKKSISKKLILWIALAALVLNIGFGIFLYSRGYFSSRRKRSGTDPNDQIQQFIEEGISAANGKDLRDISLNGVKWVVVNDKLYYFSTDYNSEDADNYLYALMDDNTIQLNDFNGSEKAQLVVPEVIDGLPVTSIGDSCFQKDIFLEKVTIPETVDYIGRYAFADCTALKEVIFSQNIIEINENAFARSGVINMRLPDTVDTIGIGLFDGCKQLESVFLPEKIQLIPMNTFRNTPKLNSVTVAADKVLIDIDAFKNQSGVTLVGVPGSYTEIYANRMNLAFEPYQAQQ